MRLLDQIGPVGGFDERKKKKEEKKLKIPHANTQTNTQTNKLTDSKSWLYTV